MPTATPPAQWPRVLEESEALLKFAAGAVPSLEPGVVAAVAAARSAAQSDAMTPMIETGLWGAYNRLALLVRPVTVDSLYATTAPIPPGILGHFFSRGQTYTLARRSARRFFTLAICVLAVVLFFQILVGYMQATITNINNAIGESSTHLAALFETLSTAEPQRSPDQPAAPSTPANAAPAGAPAAGGGAPPQPKADGTRGRRIAIPAVDTVEFIELRGRLTRIGQLLEDIGVRMGTLDGRVDFLTFVGTLFRRPGAAPPDDHVTDIAGCRFVIAFARRAPTAAAVIDAQRVEPNELALTRERIDQVVSCHSSVSQSYKPVTEQLQRWIALVNSSLLPVTLGLLGACAYVIRTISDQIRGYRFTSVSGIRHTLRIFLGALVGTVIAYFNPVTAQISIPPLALAFLGGYSVEPFFAFLDEMIDRLRTRSDLPAAPVDAAPRGAAAGPGQTPRLAPPRPPVT